MRGSKKKGKITIRNSMERKPIPIISDGAEARRGLGEGRFIPILIVDASERPDVRQLFETQKYFRQGDVRSQWAQSPSDPKNIILALIFERPVELTLLIEFTHPHLIAIADVLIRSRALYLQLGKQGDRVKNTLGTDRILIEVVGAFPEWDGILLKMANTQMREAGLSRPEAKRRAKFYVSQWRSLWDKRMREAPDSSLQGDATAILSISEDV